MPFLQRRPLVHRYGSAEAHEEPIRSWNDHPSGAESSTQSRHQQDTTRSRQFVEHLQQEPRSTTQHAAQALLQRENRPHQFGVLKKGRQKFSRLEERFARELFDSQGSNKKRVADKGSVETQSESTGNGGPLAGRPSALLKTKSDFLFPVRPSESRVERQSESLVERQSESLVERQSESFPEMQMGTAGGPLLEKQSESLPEMRAAAFGEVSLLEMQAAGTGGGSGGPVGAPPVVDRNGHGLSNCAVLGIAIVSLTVVVGSIIGIHFWLRSFGDDDFGRGDIYHKFHKKQKSKKNSSQKKSRSNADKYQSSRAENSDSEESECVSDLENQSYGTMKYANAKTRDNDPNKVNNKKSKETKKSKFERIEKSNDDKNSNEYKNSPRVQSRSAPWPSESDAKNEKKKKKETDGMNKTNDLVASTGGWLATTGEPLSSRGNAAFNASSSMNGSGTHASAAMQQNASMISGMSAMSATTDNGSMMNASMNASVTGVNTFVTPSKKTKKSKKESMRKKHTPSAEASLERSNTIGDAVQLLNAGLTQTSEFRNSEGISSLQSNYGKSKSETLRAPREIYEELVLSSTASVTEARSGVNVNELTELTIGGHRGGVSANELTTSLNDVVEQYSIATPPVLEHYSVATPVVGGVTPSDDAPQGGQIHQSGPILLTAQTSFTSKKPLGGAPPKKSPVQASSSTTGNTGSMAMGPQQQYSGLGVQQQLMQQQYSTINPQQQHSIPQHNSGFQQFAQQQQLVQQQQFAQDRSESGGSARSQHSNSGSSGGLEHSQSDAFAGKALQHAQSGTFSGRGLQHPLSGKGVQHQASASAASSAIRRKLQENKQKDNEDMDDFLR